MNTFTLSFVLLFLALGQLATAEQLDPSMHYYSGGKNIAPWELSLNFGKTKLVDGAGETTRGSLTAKPTKNKNGETNALHLTWKPRGIKNKWGSEDRNVLTLNIQNTQKQFDLSSVKDVASLVFDVNVIKAPNKLVSLTIESNWNWKTRTSVLLNTQLKKLKGKGWISIPVPLKCFDDEKVDFTKITQIFMLHTQGKMTLELGDVRLAANPPGDIICGNKP